ncbi:MAG: hypothetical protein VX642_06810 [Bdellovibrionota bacterium]|nr:hypothetical protein [Bdellovibrionota bacterium]
MKTKRFAFNFFRDFTSFLIIFSMMLGMIPASTAFAQSAGSSKPAILSLPDGMDIDNLEKFDDLFTEEHKQIAESYFKEPAQDAKDLMKILSVMKQEEEKWADKIGRDQLRQNIASRNEKLSVSGEVKNLGRFEYTALGTGEFAVPFARIVSDKTQKAYFIFDLDQIPLDQLEVTENEFGERFSNREILRRKKIAFEIRKFKASQLILSGANKDDKHTNPEVDDILKDVLTEDARELKKRPWWKTYIKAPVVQESSSFLANAFGRDITFIFVRNSSHVESESFKRPRSKLDREYWKNYWYSVWEKPQMNDEYWQEPGLRKLKVLLTGDYLLGIFSGFLQFGITHALGYAETMIPGMEPNPEKIEALAYSSLYFGIIIGTLTKLYQNWAYIGSPLARNVKSWGIALSYGALFGSLYYGPEFLFPFAGGEQMGEMMWLWVTIFANMVMKGPFKVWSMEIPRFRKAAGLSYGNFEIPWFGGKSIDTKIQQTGVDTQVYQLYGTVFKLMHLLNISFVVAAYNIPFGWIAYPGVVPIYHKITMAYVDRQFKKLKGSLYNQIQSEAKKPNTKMRNASIKEYYLTYRDQFKRNSKAEIISDHRGRSLKDFEKYALQYREAWERSKFEESSNAIIRRIPYLRTVLKGGYDLLAKIPYFDISARMTYDSVVNFPVVKPVLKTAKSLSDFTAFGLVQSGKEGAQSFRELLQGMAWTGKTTFKMSKSAFMASANTLKMISKKTSKALAIASLGIGLSTSAAEPPQKDMAISRQESRLNNNKSKSCRRSAEK